MANDYSDSERGNSLPPHGILFPISSKVCACVCYIKLDEICVDIGMSELP